MVKSTCPVCDEAFTPVNKKHRFCTKGCKGKWKYVNNDVTTASQYKQISGDWSRYLSRLLYAAGRKRDSLTRDDLLKKLVEQDYKCAISGLPLTCQLEKGVKFPHNASVDRIEAGGSYTPDNIQLVCKAVNSWRSDTPLDDFIEVCRAVVRFQDMKIGGQDGQAKA